jgi:hypothetical protein
MGLGRRGGSGISERIREGIEGGVADAEDQRVKRERSETGARRATAAAKAGWRVRVRMVEGVKPGGAETTPPSLPKANPNLARVLGEAVAGGFQEGFFQGPELEEVLGLAGGWNGGEVA